MIQGKTQLLGLIRLALSRAITGKDETVRKDNLNDAMAKITCAVEDFLSRKTTVSQMITGICSYVYSYTEWQNWKDKEDEFKDLIGDWLVSSAQYMESNVDRTSEKRIPLPEDKIRTTLKGIMDEDSVKDTLVQIYGIVTDYTSRTVGREEVFWHIANSIRGNVESDMRHSLEVTAHIDCVSATLHNWMRECIRSKGGY